MDIAELGEPPERSRKTALQKLQEDMQRQLAPLCEFRRKLDSDSSRSWTVIPRQAGH